MKPEKTPQKQAGSPSMLALGLCFGVVLGTAWDNLGLGLCVGLLLGTALDGFCK